MKMHFGIHAHLEAEADRILHDQVAGLPPAQKKDILTPYKERMIGRREVYVATGVPDAAVRRGMFHRTANRQRPELNARDGSYGPPPRGQGKDAILRMIGERDPGPSLDDLM